MTTLTADVNLLKASVSLAAIISETWPLKRNGQHLAGLCPFHAERTPSFYVYEDHFHCFGCGAHGDVITWLRATRHLAFPEAVRRLAGAEAHDRTRHHPLPVPKPMQAAPRRTANLILHCWNQGIDPAGTIVETYLHNRGGLTVPDGAPIRFHRHCQRGPHDLPGGPEFGPAMLALMTDPITGRPVGLHRTYLLPDGSGKAPVIIRGNTVLKPKAILGTWGVVRLTPDDQVSRALAITEGIENALTASQLIGWGPVWAAGTRAGIEKFPVLSWAEALTIFADADDGGVGLTAARKCAQRWIGAGRESFVHVPPAGKDWNDAAREASHELA
jgi:CHC2 zinc finger/Toprim domain